MAKKKMNNKDILFQIKRYEKLAEGFAQEPLLLQYHKGKLAAFKEVYGQDGL